MLMTRYEYKLVFIHTVYYILIIEIVRLLLDCTKKTYV